MPLTSRSFQSTMFSLSATSPGCGLPLKATSMSRRSIGSCGSLQAAKTPRSPQPAKSPLSPQPAESPEKPQPAKNPGSPQPAKSPRRMRSTKSPGGPRAKSPEDPQPAEGPKSPAKSTGIPLSANCSGSCPPAQNKKSPDQVIYIIRKRYYQEDVPTDPEELDIAQQNMR